jgi:hypothetical protein
LQGRRPVNQVEEKHQVQLLQRLFLEEFETCSSQLIYIYSLFVKQEGGVNTRRRGILEGIRACVTSLQLRHQGGIAGRPTGSSGLHRAWGINIGIS